MEEFVSFEIIVVNSELTIKFLSRNSLSKWLPIPTTTLTPLFPSSWAQTFGSGNRRWGDFLKSQHLWCITTGTPGSTQPVEVITGNPTPAEALQAAWDENSEQVQGIIGSRISQMLHPHIGMTCAETWTNFRTRFGTLGVSEIAADMYAAYSMKLSILTLIWRG